MILTGRYLSPFVRRVAIWLAMQGRAYTHQPLMVLGEDFDRLKTVNPFGRVPALTLDDGMTLVETWAIIDWLEETAPDGRRLLPAHGLERRNALQQVALAHNLAEKAVALVYETIRRPADLHWADWVGRVTGQVETGLRLLEGQVAQIAPVTTPGVAAATVASFDFVAKMHPALVQSGCAGLAALSSAANQSPAFAASFPA